MHYKYIDLKKIARLGFGTHVRTRYRYHNRIHVKKSNQCAIPQQRARATIIYHFKRKEIVVRTILRGKDNELAGETSICENSNECAATVSILQLV